jgi:hypothetical protein
LQSSLKFRPFSCQNGGSAGSPEELRGLLALPGWLFKGTSPRVDESREWVLISQIPNTFIIFDAGHKEKGLTRKNKFVLTKNQYRSYDLK